MVYYNKEKLTWSIKRIDWKYFTWIKNVSTIKIITRSAKNLLR